jgi:hypothetical protein
MIGKVMKCGRCGQWIPLAQWKYAVRRLVHDNCAAVSATTKAQEETPRGKVMRRRAGVLREIR